MKELEKEVEERIDELVDKRNISEKITDIVHDYELSGAKWKHHNYDQVFDTLRDYEQWYNSAYPLVQEYLPNREKDFKNAYKKTRKCLELDLEYIESNEINGAGTLRSYIVNGVELQIALLQSIPERVKTERLKAKKSVSSNIVANEIQKAKELFDDDSIRASGVIAGVALERHLLTMCESSGRELDFDYMDGITSLAQKLSDKNEITNDEQRKLEYLAGIRNNCSHASEKEPNKREVERLLNQTSEFIRK